MINWFDHSTRMSEAMPVIGQARGDGFPVQKIISELKKFTNPIEENHAANDGSSSKKSNATSLKILLAKEMAKEVESKRKPTSVIARLMGLEEDLSAEEPLVDHGRSKPTIHSNAINKAQGNKCHQSIRLMTQDLQQLLEYKDIYEVCEEQSGTSYFQDRTSEKVWSSENKSEQSDIVEQKFMEPCFAMEEKLIHTKELQKGLEVSSSNKDFLLELPEEPNSSYSRQLSRIHENEPPPQTKRITVLKPVSSFEIKGVRQLGTEQVNKQNALKTGKFHQGPSTKEETPSQTSRIVVLRPTPGKSGISNTKQTPRTSSFRLTRRNNLNGSLADNGATIGSSGLMHGIKLDWLDGYHQRGDSLLSSAYSSGYVGDESSCYDSEIDHSSGSEIEYIEEDGGTLSESEGSSSLWKHSWNYIRRCEDPCSGPSFCKISHFPESSIIREAKKQLSERWAMVSCDEICQENVQSSRRTCTLGEMLSVQEAKREVSTTGILSVSSDRSCGVENEPTSRYTNVTNYRKDDENVKKSPRKLPTVNSVPVISSMLDNMMANVQVSNPEGYKSKVVVVPDKGKISLKRRVSEIFLSRSKNSRRQKSSYHTSDCCTQRVETCVVHSQLDYNLNLDGNKKTVHCEDKVDSCSMQISTGASERNASVGVTLSLNCSSGNLDKQGVNKGLNDKPDQPSPTSVLDAPTEDSSCNEPETSGSISKNAISRSSAIEAIARSLSWGDSTTESQILCTRRPPSLISDVDTDESESHVLVRNLMSSAGLGSAQSSMAFTGRHLPNCPLDPVLCNKILELREQSSYRRLLFDCVNVALVEIGENALLSVFPWSKKHSRAWWGTSAPDLRVEVWGVLKDWIYGARMLVVSKRNNAGIMLSRIVKQEIEGSGWAKLMMSQVLDIIEQLEGGVMEELVEEAVLDVATCFRQ